MIGPQEIRERLETALPGSRVDVRDLTGGGDHYEVRVVSELFSGKSLIEQHRMVYGPLRDVLGGALHALTVTTAASCESETNRVEEGRRTCPET